MKKILLPILLLIASTAFCQKIDLDKEMIKIIYTQLPDNNALSTSNTYGIIFSSDAETIRRTGLSKNEIENALVLPGLKYSKDNNNVDVLLQVTIEPVSIPYEKIETRTFTQKNTAGVDETKTYYFVRSDMIAPTTIKLVNKKTGAQIENVVLTPANAPVIFKSQEFNAQNLAQNNLNTGFGTDRDNNFKKTYKAAFLKTFSDLKTKYCYAPTYVNEEFWKIDLSKAPEYTSFNDALAKTKTSLENIKYNENIEATKSELAPVMQYWAENAEKVNTTDKKMRKLKYGYLINLARTQYWLEMFEECKITCNKIIENDYDKSDGKSILSNIDYVTKALAAHNVSTRHKAREGFTSTEKFELPINLDQPVVTNANPTTTTTTTANHNSIKIKPGEMISSTKQDAQDIKKIFKTEKDTTGKSFNEKFYVKYTVNSIETFDNYEKKCSINGEVDNSNNECQVLVGNSKSKFSSSLWLFPNHSSLWDINYSASEAQKLFKVGKYKLTYAYKDSLSYLNESTNMREYDIYYPPSKDVNPISFAFSLNWMEKNNIYKNIPGDFYDFEILESSIVQVPNGYEGSYQLLLKIRIPQIKLTKISGFSDVYIRSETITATNVEYYFHLGFLNP
ncbi:MAG TPA: hypothetical protein VNB90_07380 [Cytophagaceae bacterium]|nr:hypothetical protein [Cytophagaceae bacterium]